MNLSGRSLSHRDDPRERTGSALIVALWVLVILSMLVSGLAFDANIEAGITSYYRNRLKSEYLAKAGVEYIQYMLALTGELGGAFEEIDFEQELLDVLEPLSHGSPVTINQQLGDGHFEVSIRAEPGRWSVNDLTDEEWEALFEWGNVPEDIWPDLIDCFTDWVDENDAHQLNGAESDDSFYRDRGYEVKNAPLDTVDELALIKHFSKAIVFGGFPEGSDSEEDWMPGIAQRLTVWSSGKLNINSATEDDLLLFEELDQFQIEDILEARLGEDGEEGTQDDGFESIDEVMAVIGSSPQLSGFSEKITVDDISYLRVTSVGEVNGIKRGIWCILRSDGDGVVPVYWREEQMP